MAKRKYHKPLFTSKKDILKVQALIEKHMENDESLEIRALGIQDFELGIHYGDIDLNDGDVYLGEERDCAPYIDTVLIFCVDTGTVYLDRRKEVADKVMSWTLG